MSDILTPEQVQVAREQKWVNRLADSHEALRADLATVTAERDALREERDELAKMKWCKACEMEQRFVPARFCEYHAKTLPAPQCAPFEDWRGANDDWRKR